MRTWKHKKTGNLYVAVTIARDATNGREDCESVLYVIKTWWNYIFACLASWLLADVTIFARERKEFLEKFERDDEGK